MQAKTPHCHDYYDDDDTDDTDDNDHSYNDMQAKTPHCDDHEGGVQKKERIF